MMRVLDLFSGIGGFSLGLERAGMETVAFCEIEPYCQKVLAKHWPKVPIYDDVRRLDADTLRRDGIDIDLICGGFPCQDISLAGKGAGLAGERSGLWFEYRRIIRDVRPQWVIIENVPAILSRGGSVVTNDLAALGYDCMWECIPACAVGAPHRRDRWWCVAYANSGRGRSNLTGGDNADGAHARGSQANRLPGTVCEKRGKAGVANPSSNGRKPRRAGNTSEGPRWRQPDGSGISSDLVSNANGNHGHGRGGNVQVGRQSIAGEIAEDGNASRAQRSIESGMGGMADGFSPWLDEPGDIPRVAKGVSKRVDRLKGLGNAVVPQIPEMIGKAIMEVQ